MKDLAIFLKINLIVTNDGIGVGLNPISVILQKVGNFEKEEYL
jgi:hypothetical protein